jgi:hypothetical protein
MPVVAAVEPGKPQLCRGLALSGGAKRSWEPILALGCRAIRSSENTMLGMA